MNTQSAPKSARRGRRLFVVSAAVLTVLAAIVVFSPHGLAWTRYFAARALASVDGVVRGGPNPADGGAHDHAGHDHGEHGDEAHAHDHPGHDEASAIELSEQAEANIGLRTVEVRLSDYQKTITLPAMVVERPGRSTIRVTAPLTGVVTRINPIRGEAVAPGQPLFELRLTHEEVVQAQSDLLRFLGERDVVLREIARLEPLNAAGTIPGKTLIERRYEQHKLDAAIHAQRQALLLHGLSAEQVDGIVERRELLRTFTVAAPEPIEDAQSPTERYLQVESLDVEQGQHVAAGEQLSELANHAELYIEGTAFAQDAPKLERALNGGLGVTAVWDDDGIRQETIDGLRILYVAAKVDPDSRGLHFYARLPNTLVRNVTTDGHRFVGWRFKPGQRLNLRVPVETWPSRIVLPAESVIQDGAESFVFVRYGDHFDRRAVRVEYRDAVTAVVAENGGLAVGELVAASGAHQLHLALKNKSGGAIDPHAGHNH